MCVKLPSEDLNPDPYPSHLTNTYTCEVTTSTAPKGRGGKSSRILKNFIT